MSKKFCFALIICLAALILCSLQIINDFNNECKFNGYILCIPAIGFNESLNNESLSRGVLLDNKSGVLGESKKMFCFGHRVSLHSNFLRLDELKENDSVSISNGNITVNYKVNDSYIVNPEYIIPLEPQSNTLYLITCFPIASTAKRLIVECSGI